MFFGTSFRRHATPAVLLALRPFFMPCNKYNEFWKAFGKLAVCSRPYLGKMMFRTIGKSECARIFASLLAAISMAIAETHSARADSLVRNGHIAGARTTLTLSPAQRQFLSTHRKRPKLVLTQFQRKIMLRETGVSTVKEVGIFPPNTQSCTCELADVAVRINSHQIEVSNSLYGRRLDLDDITLWSKQGEEELEDERLQKHVAPPAKEFQLRMEARKLSEAGKNEGAIRLLEQAIALNPNYIFARRDLANIWWHQASETPGKSADLARQTMLLQKAVSILGGDKSVSARCIARDFERAQARLAAKTSI